MLFIEPTGAHCWLASPSPGRDPPSRSGHLQGKRHRPRVFHLLALLRAPESDWNGQVGAIPRYIELLGLAHGSDFVSTCFRAKAS